MHSTTTSRFRAKAALGAFVMAILLVATAGAETFAQQQGGEVTIPTLPKSQRGTGGVLELPSMPAPQGGQPGNLPPMAPQPGQELEIPPRQLRNQLGYAQVTVTVTDSSGHYVTGLNQNDFKLYIDGVQRPIQFFRHDLRTPVSVGILVDTSGSMQPKLPQARRAISQFISDLNAKDDIFLVAFSDRPFMLQPFTTNHALVLQRLALLRAFGYTAIYDTVMQGLLTVERGRYDKKALLVVTDGMDNASRIATLPQVVDEARRLGVLIYSIGIGNPNASSMGLGIAIGPFVLGGGGESERVDAKTLETLSRETGAKTFIISKVGDGDLLARDCEQISHELREQYTVGFVAPDPEAGGYRNLKVAVPDHPELAVRVRKGVTIGRAEALADPSRGGPPPP